METSAAATTSAPAAASVLAARVLASECPQTLDPPAHLTITDAKAMLAAAATDDSWRAYDLLHQLAVYGRAF